jgi:hypothetical protein
MGIWSWLFPTDEDRLARAKKRMAAGRFEDARKDLMRCTLPEAEALYDKCSAEIDKADRVHLKKRLVAEGFHGWKIEVTVKSAKVRAQMEKAIEEELERAGVDLALPEVDEKAFKKAVARAQQRVRGRTSEMGAVRLVPVMTEALAKQMRAQSQ